MNFTQTHIIDQLCTFAPSSCGPRRKGQERQNRHTVPTYETEDVGQHGLQQGNPCSDRCAKYHETYHESDRTVCVNVPTHLVPVSIGQDLHSLAATSVVDEFSFIDLAIAQSLLA